MKVIFAIPTVTKPYQACLDSLAASVPLIEAAGWEHAGVYEIGCPYISAARAKMLSKAMAANPDVIVFIDHDVSWQPGDLLKLIETEGPVVAGTYRFKKPEEEYMGAIFPGLDGCPIVRADGAIKAHSIPAGFLKLTRRAISHFMLSYPELIYGDDDRIAIDLFNHGAMGGVWYGEDYSFARRWREKCGDIWIVPDLNINHHQRTDTGEVVYQGNFHRYLLRQPGGSESENPIPPAQMEWKENGTTGNRLQG